MKRILNWFATGPNAAPLTDEGAIDNLFSSKRWRLYLWLILGYGFFYTGRLSWAVAKKPMLDEGIRSV